jgi:hypothetical protein
MTPITLKQKSKKNCFQEASDASKPDTLKNAT